MLGRHGVVEANATIRLRERRAIGVHPHGVIYGIRPPSTHVEKLNPLQLKYGTVKNGAREVYMRNNTKAVFADLEVNAKELCRPLREVRESLRTTPLI